MRWPFHVGSENQIGNYCGNGVDSMFHMLCFPFPAIQVFLAKRKHDGKYYAVKVLQKKVILNRKEVNLL